MGLTPPALLPALSSFPPLPVLGMNAWGHWAWPGALAVPRGERFSPYPSTALSQILILFPDLHSGQLQWPKRLLKLVLLLELLALPKVR